MYNTFYLSWEPAFMQWLQSALGAFGETVMPIFSMLGEELILIAVLGFIYWSLDKEAGIYIGNALVVSVTWNPMLKNIALRARPYFVHKEIVCLKPVDASADIYDIAKQGFSFPSGHSANSSSVYASIALYWKKRALTILCAAAIFLVGISRFCLGVHYPSDVIAGWLLGLAAAGITALLSKAIKNYWLFAAVLLAGALPGLFYCKTTDYFTGLGMLIGYLLAVPFERRFVKFENTKKILPMILRVLGGIIIYFALNSLLKLPFSDAFLSSESAACLAFRVVRYAIILFCEIGVYPLLFNVFEKKAR